MILIFHDEINANKILEDEEKFFSSQKYKHHSSNCFIYNLNETKTI